MTRPIARPIVSSQTVEPAHNHGASRTVAATKVSGVPPAFRRISRRQLDEIDAQLTEADRAVLLFLSDVRLATGHQLARRLWSAPDRRRAEARAARRALARLEQWRIVDRLPRRVGGVRGGSASIVYFVGPTGRRLLARIGFAAKRPGFPGQRMADHALAITELVVGLHEASHRRGDLDVIEYQTEPRCWRSFIAAGNQRQTLRPDLYVRIGAGAYEDRWCIEVDRATESSPTILAQAQRYLAYLRSGEEQSRHGVFPRVVWTVPDARRGAQITGVLDRLPEVAARLFVVWPYDEVIGRLSAEAHR